MKFIGLDAHSGSSFFVVQNRRGKVLRHGKVATTEHTMLEFVQSVRRPRHLIFEEGVASQWLYVLLKDEVDEIVVCRPPERRGAKTDKIDAHQLADDLRQGRFVSVFHDDSEFMELRVLVSAHQDVTQELTRTKNRYKAMYRQSAIPVPDAPGFYLDRGPVSELPTKEKRLVARSMLRQIKVLDDEKHRYEKRFATNCGRNKVMTLLKTIPGIGDIRANQLVAMLVTPARFKTKYRFFAYAMLVKHKQTSNGREYGSKKAMGQTLLKSIFHNAVFAALKSDNAFHRKYDELVKRGVNVRAARQNVARAIAATVLGVWKSQKPYNDKIREELSNNTCQRAVQSI